MTRTPAPLPHDEIRRVYNRIGRFQDRQFYERKPIDRLVAHGDFDSATAVFELGCGTGALAARLLLDHLPAIATYRAVDLSETMVRLASDRIAPWQDRCEILQVDGSLPLPGTDGEFDRFIAAYVLDLLAPDDAAGTIAEAARLVRPGGLLCLAGLTRGVAPLHRLVTRGWSALWRHRPSLVGGCRPIEIKPLVQAPWTIDHWGIVPSWGVPTEVLVAVRAE